MTIRHLKIFIAVAETGKMSLAAQRLYLTQPTVSQAIRELEEHGYAVRRNGVSNYTLKKKTRVVFVGKIPDDTDDIRTTKDIPSWKRMCYCILKNDHTCRFMGFGVTREQNRRIEMIRNKYQSIEELDYGV